ncbi:MAG: hypothetical protein ACRDPJ_06825 [Nocardioidaceae bacterium]
MRVSPASGQAHTRLAQWAVALAAASVIMLALAFSGLGFGGAGALTSFVAFALAVVARLRHERWAPLWLPLLLFPALVVSSPLWV